MLVDEYDKPLVNVLHKPEVFVQNRETLVAVYSVIKTQDSRLKFVMLTGISRFGKVGIFSGLNNLEDISLEPRYAGIVGFSQNDIHQYFGKYLEQLQRRYDKSADEMIDALRLCYNGYSWDGESRWYNPSALLEVFESKKLADCWFRNPTPTFLYEQMLRGQVPKYVIDSATTDLKGYVRSDGSLPSLPLLFQSGWLTIDRIEGRGFDRVYHLRCPNEDVAKAFTTLSLATSN